MIPLLGWNRRTVRRCAGREKRSPANERRLWGQGSAEPLATWKRSNRESRKRALMSLHLGKEQVQKPSPRLALMQWA